MLIIAMLEVRHPRRHQGALRLVEVAVVGARPRAHRLINGSFGRRGRTGNQPVVWDPSRVPAFDGLPAYIALEAADLATICHRLGAAINRAAFAGPVKRF